MARQPYRDPPSTAAHIAQILSYSCAVSGKYRGGIEYISEYSFQRIRGLPFSEEERLYVEHERWTNILHRTRCPLQIAINTLYLERGTNPKVLLDVQDFLFMMAKSFDPDLMTAHPKFPRKLLDWFVPDAVRQWLLEWGGDQRIATWVATAFRDWVTDMDEPLDPECEDDARILALCN